MKKQVVILSAILLAFYCYPQERAMIPESRQNTSVSRLVPQNEKADESATQKESPPIDLVDFETIGITQYDYQASRSMQNRMYRYEDGYIGATFTFVLDAEFGYEERGTGFNNYIDGEWGDWPVERLESERTGWPSYSPYGEDGEMAVAHFFGTNDEGLIFSYRDEKGVGDWSELKHYGPDGHTLVWPRMVTNGDNNECIHVIAQTLAYIYGGSLYEGQDGALLYSRSSDGGETWDIENVIIEGIGSDYYLGFGAETYEFANPRGDTLAILIGNDWNDLVLLKSLDNGDSWEKTVIWEHPYPLWDPNAFYETDTFYCPDGSHHLAIDTSGMVHVAFGINRAYSDGEDLFWFPYVDGVGYWNEVMPAFTNNLNALNPYGDEDTELLEDYNLIGWMQDLDGNGEIDLLDEYGTYHVGAASHVQLVLDEDNNVFVMFDAITEGYDNGIKNYRHIWARGSGDNGLTWGDFLDVNEDLYFVFSECVFPSCSPASDEDLHFIFQEDSYPGMAIVWDMHPYTDNNIIYVKLAKEDLITIPPGNNLSGIITAQESGNPISGALIYLDGTSFSTVSSDLGTYSISDIPAGNYLAICQKEGFLTASLPVEILGDENTFQDFSLIQGSPPEETGIGNTFYDLQTNRSVQNRFHYYDDGTLAGVWTMGIEQPSFPGRGTGYAYYDGQIWDPAFPLFRIESLRTGWPSYCPYGLNGELVVSHDFAQGELVILTRDQKGSGDWTESYFEGPDSYKISWNRTITAGENLDDIHILSITLQESNAGSVYDGLDGAITYSRTSDGGVSWEEEHLILDGMTSDDYFGFGSDTYEWAAPQGDQIAFLTGSAYTDLFIMRSSDGGDTWEKEMIWTHPYPFLDPTDPIVTDPFYCPDGAHSIAFDADGKLHVVFGITRMDGDGSEFNLYPGVDGIGYWNEDMEAFSNDLNALSPYGETGSELVTDTTLVGWSQDVNNNGELDFLDDWGEYFLGVSSMPQLVIDPNNNLFLVYSSVTEGYDNSEQNYRHLWARGFSKQSGSWGEFLDLNTDVIYVFSECVYPSIASRTDNKIHLIFQEDPEPGLAVIGDTDPYTDNTIRYTNILKSDLLEDYETGSLEGTVTDIYTGDPIEDANLTLLQTSYSTSSNSSGQFGFAEIPPGSYSLQCSMSGYFVKTVEVLIEAGGVTLADVQLYPSSTTSEELVGTTYYDLQSNGSMSNRIFLHEDGTVGATWTMGFDHPGFTDRRTGYNYYDGNSWGALPAEFIEDDRTGWPSYAPLGENGEIVVAHYSGASTEGLVISSREEKGSGEWSMLDFDLPASDYYLWPRAVTGGVEHSELHVIALSAPTTNGGSIYEDMDGALLYSRSPDGGQTWDYEHVLLDEINNDYYIGIESDSYEIQARDDLVAFLAGGPWTDLFLMKSTDNGDSWTKTVIWEHPYPFLDDEITTETFYYPDGDHCLAFDNMGNVHVAFGIGKGYMEFGGQNFEPEVDGVAYWNEDMPVFSNDLNALDPSGGSGSELVEDYNLIGWSQDMDGNGIVELMDDWGWYSGRGISSMPQLVIDEYDRIFMVYSSVTEGYDNGVMNYRQLWARSSPDNGTTWGTFVHLTSDITYIFSECVFPSCSPSSDEELHLVFMEDFEPGMAVSGDNHPFVENNIKYMHILKTDPIPNAGQLSGIVSDLDTGLPITGAIVEITGLGLSDESDENGNYYFPQVPAGNHSASCSAMGYYFAEEDFTILLNEQTVLDFELEVGDDLYPPQFLQVEMVGNDAVLSWSEPVLGDPLYYIIYKNDEFLAVTSDLTYIDEELQPDTYEYYVTGFYDNGESFPSNVVVVFISPPCNAPEDLTVLVVGPGEITLSWDPPAGNIVLGYNLYQNGEFLAYIIDPFFWISGLSPGIYEYFITTVCEDGESEPSETIIIEIPINIPLGCEDFDDLNVAGMVAEQLGGYWTTWSGNPGGSEDAHVANEKSYSPFNSFVVNTESIDLIRQLADEAIEEGTYVYSHFMYVSSGNSGYFNIQSDPVPGVFWVIELYFNDGGSGKFVVDGVDTDFAYLQDTWFLVDIIFDLDWGIGQVLFNNAVVFDFSTSNSIGGVNYYGSSDGGTPGAYYDDVCFNNVLPLSLYPPQNLEVEFNGFGMQLTWDEPAGEEKSKLDLLGYNIYYSYEWGPYSFLDFIAETIYFHDVTGLGEHCYFITAVYDEGESVASNTDCDFADAIDEIEVTNIKLYPNPASDKIFIKSDDPVKEVTVFSFSGILQEQIQLNSNDCIINVEEYLHGVYIFRIEKKDQVIFRRVIIK